MNDMDRLLFRAVCDGDLRSAQKCARDILANNKLKKDENFCSNLLRKLDTKSNFIELPHNLRDLLVAEDVSNFNEKRFLVREADQEKVTSVLSALKASERLSELGIHYVPSLLLHGESGGGKTLLGRYIAYRTNRPFVYVRFSNVVSSYLGSTQSNLSNVFDYVKTMPCVLCFDEIDAVGMARGQKNDVGEMNRVVIALMQEFDNLPNNVIVVGTTNRRDRLDEALLRRFSLEHEVVKLTSAEVRETASKFFSYVGLSLDGWFDTWYSSVFKGDETAATVVNKCTKYVVEQIVAGVEI